MAQGTGRFGSAAPHRDEGAVMASPMASAQRKHGGAAGLSFGAQLTPADAVVAAEVGANGSRAEEAAEKPAEAEEKAAPATSAEEKAEAKEAPTAPVAAASGGDAAARPPASDEDPA